MDSGALWYHSKGHQAPVVVFDSGVGGLSVYAEIRRRLPGQSVVYCSDNAAFPYGNKPRAMVEERTAWCLQQLEQQVQPCVFVIACNTASTTALERVRAERSVPVVGVVPAIKPAAQMSRNKVIGLLATPATVSRDYMETLINHYAADCRVIRVGSVELVHEAENKLRGQGVNQAVVNRVMEAFCVQGQDPDCIVLGCTHFPLLKAELSEGLFPVQFVDSGEAIARRVAHWLPNNPPQQEMVNGVLFTRQDKHIQALKPYLHQQGFAQVGVLDQSGIRAVQLL